MTKRILIPTQSYLDWQQLLAKPKQHWKAGYSAMTLARSWEAAESIGFPPEVRAILDSSDSPELKGLSLILAIPEFKVSLPGGDRPSQTDVFALAHGPEGLLAIAVEGKVDEAFGPTVAQKKAEKSEGIDDRLTFLLQFLGLPAAVPQSIRYQLLHRTASALLIAKQFYARAAVMLVHSFSLSNKWFEDFEAFAALFKVCPKVGELASVGELKGMQLFLGWCRGDQRFRESEEV